VNFCGKFGSEPRNQQLTCLVSPDAKPARSEYAFDGPEPSGSRKTSMGCLTTSHIVLVPPAFLDWTTPQSCRSCAEVWLTFPAARAPAALLSDTVADGRNCGWRTGPQMTESAI
jgi:hypothetical protein